MFGKDDGYKFTYHGFKNIDNNGIILIRHILSFKSRKNNIYIVEVEEFSDFQLMIIKFYLKSHRLSDNKYNLLTKKNETPGILTTCMNIMIWFYNKNPYRSFGFIGSNSLNEEVTITKRFKLYRILMRNLFSPIKFMHFEYESKSAYLLLNKDFASNNYYLLRNIEKFFETNYDILIQNSNSEINVKVIKNNDL